ncbi:MAG: hypothetical protein V2A73_00695, partial [Pseudomonadota bacterium]
MQHQRARSTAQAAAAPIAAWLFVQAVVVLPLAACSDNDCAQDTGCGGADSQRPDLVQYGDEWLTAEEMEARRADERATIGWDFERKVACGHYLVYSTASSEQIADICAVAEALYQGYVGFVGAKVTLPLQEHPYLKVKLFKDRDEFRAVVLGGQGWAEGLYDGVYCNQYYDATAGNPYHWFLHEATHQLNFEVARLELPQWLQEGTACYFGTSTYRDGQLILGQADDDSYPVWWVPKWDVESVWIPLQAIVSG